MGLSFLIKTVFSDEDWKKKPKNKKHAVEVTASYPDSAHIAIFAHDTTLSAPIPISFTESSRRAVVCRYACLWVCVFSPTSATGNANLLCLLSTPFIKWTFTERMFESCVLLQPDKKILNHNSKNSWNHALDIFGSSKPNEAVKRIPYY